MNAFSQQMHCAVDLLLCGEMFHKTSAGSHQLISFMFPCTGSCGLIVKSNTSKSFCSCTAPIERFVLTPPLFTQHRILSRQPRPGLTNTLCLRWGAVIPAGNERHQNWQQFAPQLAALTEWKGRKCDVLFNWAWAISVVHFLFHHLSPYLIYPLTWNNCSFTVTTKSKDGTNSSKSGSACKLNNRLLILLLILLINLAL